MDRNHPEYDVYLKWLRGLSMQERGKLIMAKCREAAEEERVRRQRGLPPTEPEPFPASTLELFRRLAAHHRSQVQDSDEPDNT